MPPDKIESTAAAVTIWGSLITYTLDTLNWLTQNAAAVSVLILIGGFVIQVIASWRNKREHELRMQMLYAEAAAKGVVVDES